MYSFTDDSSLGTYCYEDGPTLSAVTGIETRRYIFFVSVARKEQDLHKVPPPSAPLTAMRRDGWTFDTPSASTNATTTPSTTLAPSTPPDETISAAASKSGFSTGAAAGTGVGVTVAIFDLIAALWFFFRRLRKRRRSDSPGESDEVDAYRDCACSGQS